MVRASAPAAAIAIGIALTLPLAACAAPEPDRTPRAVETTPPPSASPSPSATAVVPLRPSGPPVDVVTGLSAPWSIAQLPGGMMLITERDRARILELSPGGGVREVGAVPDAEPFGEGGLLGIAVDPATVDDDPAVYVHLTAAADNRIVRFDLMGEPGSLGLGASETVLAGIPKSRTHNGGRIAFGPDGMLYATAGDAGDPAAAQDPASLAGKILRMTPEGAVPADNPDPGSLVYSLGHRNPQGIAWDATGQLWAAEFGPNTWDELNRIEPGANYGWPTVEGIAGEAGFIDPVQQWATSEASPSGIAIVGGTIFIAGLRGERLWAVDVDAPETGTPLLAGELGRLRDAVAGPDGSLLILTNNTDGRGEPRAGDDRLVRLPLAPRD